MEKELLDLKEKILNNISILMSNYQSCIDANMKDPNSSFYNKIESLIEQVNATEDKMALSEIIMEAKTIESQLDIWITSQGQSTLNISWPDI
jgi:hypothetical protein